MKTEIRTWIHDCDRFIVQSNYIDETMFCGFISEETAKKTRSKYDVGIWKIKLKEIKHAD
jgi:hypothetical protein